MFSPKIISLSMDHILSDLQCFTDQYQIFYKQKSLWVTRHCDRHNINKDLSTKLLEPKLVSVFINSIIIVVKENGQWFD